MTAEILAKARKGAERVAHFVCGVWRRAGVWTAVAGAAVCYAGVLGDLFFLEAAGAILSLLAFTGNNKETQNNVNNSNRKGDTK